MTDPSTSGTPEVREEALRLLAAVRSDYATVAEAASAVAFVLGIPRDTILAWQEEASRQPRTEAPKKSKGRFLGVRQLIAGTVVVVLGGLGLAYAESWLGFSHKAPDLQVDEYTVSPPSDGGGSVTLDIRLLNTGSQIAIVNSATVIIQEFATLPACTSEGALAPTGTYRKNLPNDPRRGQRLTIPVSQTVPADGPDRFDVLFGVAPDDHGTAQSDIYIYRILVYLNYNVGARPLEIGEMTLSLPPGIGAGDYYWNKYFATHPYPLNVMIPPSQMAAYMKCVTGNSRKLQSILRLPGRKEGDLPALKQLRY